MTAPSSDKHNETDNKLQEDIFESILKSAKAPPCACSLLKDEFNAWRELDDCPSDDIKTFIKWHNVHTSNRTKLH